MNRFRVWAKRALATLRKDLGGVCQQCGKSPRKPLEFDCIAPQGDRHHKYETNRKAVFYRKQHAAGNLQLLCADCHAAKSAHEQYLGELNDH